MTRKSIRNVIVTASLTSVVLGAALVTPGSAHDSTNILHNWRRHYRPLAKQTFFTKATSDARFVNVEEPASDADLLDGMDSSAFAGASHTHAGSDITSGTVAAARIDAAIARVAEVFDLVLADDGADSGLDANLLDGQSSTAFATASHTHAGGEITSGTVAEARIDALLARDAEVFAIVAAADGADSGLDADLLDGLSSDAFVLADNEAAVPWFKEADGSALATTSERVIFTAPQDVTVTGASIEPAGAVTASDANFATITLARRDAGGGGKVTVASTTTQTTGTGSWTAFAAESLGTLANASLSEGQKLTIEVSKTGLGVALPVLTVQIEYTVA
jgi:hypothetical protein